MHIYIYIYIYIYLTHTHTKPIRSPSLLAAKGAARPRCPRSHMCVSRVALSLCDRFRHPTRPDRRRKGGY